MTIPPSLLPLELFNYHKWPLTDLQLVDLIIKVLKKAKLDKQQKMLLSLRFILRHIVLKYIIVAVHTRTAYHMITTYCSTYRSAIVLEIEIT